MGVRLYEGDTRGAVIRGVGDAAPYGRLQEVRWGGRPLSHGEAVTAPLAQGSLFLGVELLF